jgi:4-hydroxy-tetrahydrodipicolinate synthase
MIGAKGRGDGMETDVRWFQGLFVPHVTPFDEAGSLDRESLERLANRLASQRGVAGLVSCARIGEGPVLSADEKLGVYEIAGTAAQRAGRLHIATIAPQSTDEAVELLRRLEKLPVDAAMIFPPLLFAWGKVGPELKVRFFEDLSRASPMPLVLFQVPVASYWYDPETICRIAQIERVVALKEASFNINLFTETTRQLQRTRSPMQVLTGNDRFVAQSYMLGAKGALIGVSNLATERWGAMDQAGRSGDFSQAMAIQEELEDLKELVFAEPIVDAVARIKAILRHEGWIKSDGVRKPQLGISPEEKRRLIESYELIEGDGTARARAAGV